MPAQDSIDGALVAGASVGGVEEALRADLVAVNSRVLKDARHQREQSAPSRVGALRVVECV